MAANGVKSKIFLEIPIPDTYIIYFMITLLNTKNNIHYAGHTFMLEREI